MITPYISVRGKVNSGINVKGKIGHATEKLYPELEDVHIVPSGETQIIKSKDKYGINEVTVEGISAAVDEDIQPENIRLGKNILGVDGIFDGIDTSDATATSDDILEGKTAYVNKQKLEGTISEYDGTYEGNANEGIVITDATHLCYAGARQEVAQQLVDLCGPLTNMKEMFASCRTLTEIDVSKLDTSQCTNMEKVFSYCEKLTGIDVSNWDTSNVTTMRDLFYRCFLVKILDVENFDTSNVTDMYGLFNQCEAITKLDLSKWDTSKVTTMGYMFNGCSDLTELDISNFDTSNVTDMGSMFRDFIGTSLDLRNFDTSKVTNMSYMMSEMSYCTDLDLSSWDLSKVTSVGSMFWRTSRLKRIKSFRNLGKAFTSKTTNNYSYSLLLNESNNLEHDSLLDIITNGLYDLNLTYDVANGGTLYRQKFQIGSTNIAKLTDEEIQIAIDKGWDVTT